MEGQGRDKHVHVRVAEARLSRANKWGVAGGVTGVDERLKQRPGTTEAGNADVWIGRG